MGLDLNTFKNFDISYKNKIKMYVDNCAKKSTDYSFVNLFCWQDNFKSVWTVYEDLLIIYYKKIDYIFMPCGRKISIDDIVNVSNSFKNQGLTGNYLLFDKEYVNENKNELAKYFNIEEDDINTNYIHLTERLVKLQGKKLNKKKNLVSQFKKRYPDYKLFKITKQNIIDCFQLFNKWLAVKDLKGMFAEYTAFIRAYLFYNELDLDGLMIMVNNEVVAFSIFSELNEDTANIHFEKYLYNFKGSAQIINFESAKYLVNKYKYINREQDLGIPGLKKSKLSYDPDCLLKYYRLIRKD